MSDLPCEVGTCTSTNSGHFATASRPRKKRVTPRSRASYETAMMLPFCAAGSSTRPSRTATRAAAGCAGSETTPPMFSPPPELLEFSYGLYCTTAIGRPRSDGSSARSQAQ